MNFNENDKLLFIDASWNKDELIRFWAQKDKGSRSHYCFRSV